jgi:hypothetical protein
VAGPPARLTRGPAGRVGSHRGIGSLHYAGGAVVRSPPLYGRTRTGTARERVPHPPPGVKGLRFAPLPPGRATPALDPGLRVWRADGKTTRQAPRALKRQQRCLPPAPRRRPMRWPIAGPGGHAGTTRSQRDRPYIADGRLFGEVTPRPNPTLGQPTSLGSFAVLRQPFEEALTQIGFVRASWAAVEPAGAWQAAAPERARTSRNASAMYPRCPSSMPWRSTRAAYRHRRREPRRQRSRYTFWYT